MQRITARRERWRGWAGAALAALLALAMVSPAQALMTFRRGNDAEPESLDPHRANSTWENNIIGDLFLGLTQQDPLGQPIPGAAESWTTTADGLIWTFKLRPGLVWSDGSPLKASDFVFAFRSEEHTSELQSH